MIRESQSRFPVSAFTHPGMTGKNNEDRFAVSAFYLNARNRTPVLLAVLCDGIGGHKAGEVAADLAVNHISQTVAESDGKSPLETLERGIQRANQAIFQESNNDNGKQGMGSTTACVWMIGNRLFTATVGDSRIYLIQGDRIRQVSIDHTWLQDALDSGLLTPDQVEGHPNRHVIRRYLGGPQPPEVDFRLRFANGESDQQMVRNQGSLLNAGDRVLLCSDGLTDLVSNAEILDAFMHAPAQKAVEDLVDLANSRGGHDNITIVTFNIPNGTNGVVKKRSAVPAGCAISAIILGVIVLVASTFVLLRGLPWQNENISSTPPIVATINPIMTSAPRQSATPASNSVSPAPAWTATPMSLSTRDVSAPGYDAPPNANDLVDVTPSATP